MLWVVALQMQLRLGYALCQLLMLVLMEPWDRLGDPQAVEAALVG